MKRLLLLAACAAAAAGCVSVEGMPDPHGALKPGQRVVVAVYPSPGPWIVGESASKAESAAQITPLGFLVQTAEDHRTLTISKNLQQYLPRPRLGLAVQDALLKALDASRSTATVQTAIEAGLSLDQLAQWNKSTDQLDWRQRYYAPDPDQPAPRDYAKVLTLDDALIVDVNVSFGAVANDDGHLLPTMSAATRVYRGDTMKLMWEHEEVAADQASSATLTDYQVQPWTLTDSLQKLAPGLGTAVANSFLKAFLPVVSTTTPTGGEHIQHKESSGGGLVSMAALEKLSTATAAGVAASTSAAVAPSGAPPATALPNAAPATPPDVSTPTVSASTYTAPAPAPPPH